MPSEPRSQLTLMAKRPVILVDSSVLLGAHAGVRQYRLLTRDAARYRTYFPPLGRDLGAEYLIWQGKIWSLGRTSEGWARYSGGMHDPASITGGHHDHLHITVRGN